MPEFQLGRYWIATVHGSSCFYRFWYDAGTREVSRRSLKTDNFEEAKIRLAAIVLKEGEATPRQAGDVTLISVFNRYWTEHSDRRPNPSGARRAGVLLLDFLGDNAAKVGILTKAKQREFIAHLYRDGLSVAYISRIQAIIQAALKRAVADEDEVGMLLRAPKVITTCQEIAAILDAPEPSPDNWHPTLDQIAAFTDAAVSNAVLDYAVLTLAFAGRPNAVLELRPEQFDERNGLLAFNQAGRRQTKKYRPTLPVPPRLLPHLRFIDGPTRKPWQETRLRAGLPTQFRPKSLRHFMATEMRKRGVPREQREEWMGHRRHSTNDIYGTFAPDYLAAARDCADAVLSELEALAKLSIFRQVHSKSEGRFIGKDLQRFDPIAEIGAGEGIRTLDPNLGNVKKTA